VYALDATRRSPDVTHRTPVYVVCSPRARVGKTLLARLLIDFLRMESQPVEAFDLDKSEPSLLDYLPSDVTSADINDTRDQVELFDHLVVNDGIVKVLDVGHSAFDPFFALVEQIDFPAEAHRRLVQPCILFVMDVDRSSSRAVAGLQRRFPDLPLIPVHNEAVMSAHRFAERRPSSAPLRIPLLPPVLKAVVDKPSFSFVNSSGRSSETPSLLQAWLKQVFVQFRELELRLLLKELSLQIRG
jgi:hypothetical protein